MSKSPIHRCCLPRKSARAVAQAKVREVAFPSTHAPIEAMKGWLHKLQPEIGCRAIVRHWPATRATHPPAHNVKRTDISTHIYHVGPIVPPHRTPISKSRKQIARRVVLQRAAAVVPAFRLSIRFGFPCPIYFASPVFPTLRPLSPGQNFRVHHTF
jgi:hypothetical protein